MYKLNKNSFLFFSAGIMFVAAGVLKEANTYYAIGAMFFILGFSRLSKAK
jgi:hypothetical protein